MTRGREDEEHLIVVVTTTVDTGVTAAALARAMVEQRLAACVQIDPEVTSLYRWKGEVREEREARLVVKTTPAREAALRSFLAAHHPYELPQFVAFTVPASPEYARWVRSEVGDVAAGPGAPDAPALAS